MRRSPIEPLEPSRDYLSPSELIEIIAPTFGQAGFREVSHKKLGSFDGERWQFEKSPLVLVVYAARGDLNIQVMHTNTNNETDAIPMTLLSLHSGTDLDALSVIDNGPNAYVESARPLLTHFDEFAELLHPNRIAESRRLLEDQNKRAFRSMCDKYGWEVQDEDAN